LNHAARNLPECKFAAATFDTSEDNVFKCLTSEGVDDATIAFFEAVIGKPSFIAAAAAKMNGASSIYGGFHGLGASIDCAGTTFSQPDHAVLFSQMIAPSLSAIVAGWKPVEYGQFRQPDLGFVTELAQTVFSSLRIRTNMVHSEIAGISRSLNRLDLGLMVVDQDLQIHQTNSAGQLFLDLREFLYQDCATLKFADRIAETRLRQLLRHLAGKRKGAEDGDGVIAVRKADDEQLLRCVVTILRDGDDAILGPPLFGLTVPVHRAARGADSTQLRRAGLSPAEAGLAADLLRGLTVAQHATSRGVTIATARAHLKRAMMRLGVHRQADLIRHLMNLN
jgi:DNA-binding CsgD family transcriptional regulator